MEEVLPLDWVTWVICCEDCDVFGDGDVLDVL